MAFKVIWGKKTMFWAFKCSIFYIFANFWVMKSKPFVEKAKKKKVSEIGKIKFLLFEAF